MPSMKRSTLDDVIAARTQQLLEEAANAGCRSVRDVGEFLGIKHTRAWRLLKKHGYTQEVAWKPPIDDPSATSASPTAGRTGRKPSKPAARRSTKPKA